MPRLPEPGKDAGSWGDILNEYLSTTLASDGTLKANIVDTAQLNSNAVTNTVIATATIAEDKLSSALQTKLNAKADATALASGLSSKVDTASVGVANGIATLDATTKVPESQIPDRLSASELTTTYVPFGYQLIPDSIRPVFGLTEAPPGTDQKGPIETTTIYNATDAAPFQLVSLGIQSYTLYGGADYGSVAAKGTAHGFTALMDVQTSPLDTNEHAAFMGWQRYAAGAKGRAWFADYSLHGPIGTRPDLLTGVTMLINQYYNGTPISGPAAGQWIVTKPGQGAGRENGHEAATTYKVDVGLGIVGFGGEARYENARL